MHIRNLAQFVRLSTYVANSYTCKSIYILFNYCLFTGLKKAKNVIDWTQLI